MHTRAHTHIHNPVLEHLTTVFSSMSVLRDSLTSAGGIFIFKSMSVILYVPDSFPYPASWFVCVSTGTLHIFYIRLLLLIWFARLEDKASSWPPEKPRPFLRPKGFCSHGDEQQPSCLSGRLSGESDYLLTQSWCRQDPLLRLVVVIQPCLPLFWTLLHSSLHSR